MVEVDRALKHSGGPYFRRNEVSTEAVSFVYNDVLKTEL
jgi:hypothetical protein